MTTSTSTTTTADGQPADAPSDGSGLERIHDPVHRVAYGFEPGDGCLWVHSWFEPGGNLPEHFHPSLEEHWQAVEGTLRAKVDGTWSDLRPEDGPVYVGRNVRHALKNESGAPAHGLSQVVPGGRLEEFLTEASRAGQDGLYNARSMPTSWRGAVWIAKFAYSFRDETVMCSPPPALQRILLPPIARLAR
jgi:quercetin dioxygenase-like cupin family protein